MNFQIDEKWSHIRYQTTMPDGSVWEVPVILIAMNRALYHKDTYQLSMQEAMNGTLELFNTPYEVADWAKNNMDWEDVKTNAICITSPSEVDYQEGWINGEFSVVKDK